MTIQEKQDAMRIMTATDGELLNAYSYLSGSANLNTDTVYDKMLLLERLKKKMQDDVVHFCFRKTNGEHREAYGTRMREIIDRHSAQPKDAQKQSGGANNTFSYFDIEKQAWRCFRFDTIIDIYYDYEI